MNRFARLFAIAIMISYAVAVPAWAEETSSPAANKRDPNEMICESEPLLGSRLAKRRTCMTRSQWAERRALDRQVVERTQMTPCQPTRSSNCY